MEESLYKRLGGAAAVKAATELFYQKVLADERINHFFDGIDIDKQIAKQKAFLTLAFGGPNKYNGKSLTAGHEHLVTQGLNDSHFDAVIENLGATLIELGVPEELIGEAATIAESVRADVLGKTKESMMDHWKGWKKVKTCDGCEQYGVLQDHNGHNRVLLPCSEDCSKK
jgi:hemoglobin